jgi:hypothetical protein
VHLTRNGEHVMRMTRKTILTVVHHPIAQKMEMKEEEVW